MSGSHDRKDPEAAAQAIEQLAAVEGRNRLYAHYDTLREADPIHKSRHPLFPDCWFFSRYDDIDSILKDRRFVQDGRNAEVFAGTEGAYADMVSRILIFLPPGGPHERTRQLIYRAFTPKAVERRRERVVTVVEDLVARVGRGGSFDLLHDFLYVLPTTVIAELLGASEEEREQLMACFSSQGHEVADVGSATDEQHRQADRAVELFTTNVREMIERHRKAPADDVLTTLIQASDDGDQLSEDEVIAAVYILIGAGHETTANLLGNGLAHLLPDRAQWEALVTHPERVPTALEELLRFDTSVQFNQRVANEDVEYRGAKIAENDRIIILLGAANRDPAVFAQPDRLDLARNPNPHLSFGAGLYHCLGIHLARLEMQVALDALVRRMPGLRLKEEPAWRPTWMMRGLERLPVEM